MILTNTWKMRLKIYCQSKNKYEIYFFADREAGRFPGQLVILPVPFRKILVFSKFILHVIGNFIYFHPLYRLRCVDYDRTGHPSHPAEGSETNP
jgi:hypothetical protein